MRILRHLVALGIIAGFAYLFVQQQKQPARVEIASEQFDPFSGWDELDGAPAFDAAPSFNASSEADAPPHRSDVPQPIPFSVAGRDDVIADLTNWSESVNNDIQKQLDGAHQQATQSLQQSKDGVQSLWNEPGQAIKRTPRQSTPAQPGSSRAGVARQGSTQPKQNTNGNSPASDIAKQIPDTIRKAVDQLKSETTDPKTNLADNNAKASESQAQPARPLAYREFTLGVGPRATACVIDQSVSQDGLLLSTLFTGLRREWTSDLERNREQRLILLVGQPSAASGHNREELQQRLQQAGVSRVVHLVRSNDSRGWLKFSSEEESIAALVSVPGAYRLEADPKLAARIHGDESLATVGIELPREISTQESATVNLVSAALLADWGQRPDLPYSSQISKSMTPQKTPAEKTTPQAESTTEPPQQKSEETTSSFFAELYQGKPSPRKQAKPQPKASEGNKTAPQTDQTGAAEQNSLLGQAESLWNQLVDDGDDTSSSLQQQVKKELSDATDQVPSPIDLLPEPPKDLSSGGLASNQAGSRTVDMLPPPPAFTPRPNVTSIDQDAFFKLPPPPPGK